MSLLLVLQLLAWALFSHTEASLNLLPSGQLTGTLCQCPSDVSLFPCRQPVFDSCGNACGFGTALRQDDCNAKRVITGLDLLELTDYCNNACVTSFSNCTEAVAEARVADMYLIEIEGVKRPVYCDLEGYSLVHGAASDTATYGWIRIFDSQVAQVTGASGTTTNEWPLLSPTSYNGHLDYSKFASHSVKYECSTDNGASWLSGTSDVFAEQSPFQPGVHGILSTGEWGHVGTPTSWGSSYYMCGDLRTTSASWSGFGLCNGPGSGLITANHIASATYRLSPAVTSIGCHGAISDPDNGVTVDPNFLFRLWAK
eukprot:TRINITY_DN10764_c0_g1_i1.p1 TRINITY_DN10764_c0_g1~~TRINITY_DN10764_c0_g1_i1.p1  ORF type:complete len:313 (+),score=6.11 TRINITY_DN10764_c0_g1_i1:90-1028(+)